MQQAPLWQADPPPPTCQAPTDTDTAFDSSQWSWVREQAPEVHADVAYISRESTRLWLLSKDDPPTKHPSNAAEWFALAKADAAGIGLSPSLDELRTNLLQVYGVIVTAVHPLRP